MKENIKIIIVLIMMVICVGASVFIPVHINNKNITKKFLSMNYDQGDVFVYLTKTHNSADAFFVSPSLRRDYEKWRDAK